MRRLAALTVDDARRCVVRFRQVDHHRRTRATRRLPTQPPQITLAPGETLPVGETLAAGRRRRWPRPRRRQLLDTLPKCPTDALASATGPVELTFWHGMNGPLVDELQKLDRRVQRRANRRSRSP